MATIEIDHVTKVFGSDVVAVDDVTLTMGDGEFLVLVGPSGCGKSTLLRMIAGLEEVTAGTIRIDGVDDGEPSRRAGADVDETPATREPHGDRVDRGCHAVGCASHGRRDVGVAGVHQPDELRGRA